MIPASLPSSARTTRVTRPPWRAVGLLLHRSSAAAPAAALPARRPRRRRGHCLPAAGMLRRLTVPSAQVFHVLAAHCQQPSRLPPGPPERRAAVHGAQGLRRGVQAAVGMGLHGGAGLLDQRRGGGVPLPAAPAAAVAQLAALADHHVARLAGGGPAPEPAVHDDAGADAGSQCHHHEVPAAPARRRRTARPRRPQSASLPRYTGTSRCRRNSRSRGTCSMGMLAVNSTSPPSTAPGRPMPTEDRSSGRRRPPGRPEGPAPPGPRRRPPQW